MSVEGDSPDSSDKRLHEIIAAYLLGADAGKAPDREKLMAEHPDLRDALRAFFADHDRMKQAAAGTPSSPDGAPATRSHTFVPEVAIGTRIGPYKLLQKIGEGGMGVVYMAEQEEPVRRKVALKIIKPGLDSAQVIARFEAERQALALMDHQNIARVFDAGTTETGRPFFVMELVHGVPITRYCDENKLTPRERLELFVPVCQAIQHAHQKGIIHRDIKPSNLLVTLYDGRPVAKVIDFGVAKAIETRLTERTLFTQFGQIVGTFEYMSPEQAEMSALGVDTRSDIFSLGVVFYELLTGTTPLERRRLRTAAFDELLRIIREEEPPRPSMRLSSSAQALASISAQRGMEPAKLTRLVRGELDWIVMKCLEKDRTRRYETANALARDIQRYLADEPVEACPPSAAYRLRKFARKNRKWLATAAAFVLLLVTGIVGLIAGLFAVQAEERRTAEALDRVKAEQKKSEAALIAETKARTHTREALNTVTDEVVEELLGKHSTIGEKEKAFLLKVLAFYEEFAAERGDTEESRGVAAEGQSRVAKIYSFLGDREKAAAGYQAAVELFKKLTADFPGTAEHRRHLGVSYQNLGVQLDGLGKRANAEAAYREALALQETLANDFPGVPQYRQDLGLTHHKLGTLLDESGRFAEAGKSFEKAIELREKLSADSPTTPQYRDDLAASQINLGLLRYDERRFDEAVRIFGKGIGLREQLVTDFPAVAEYRHNLAGSYVNLALPLGEQGKRAEQETACRRAVALSEKAVAEFPGVPKYRVFLARAHMSRHVALMALKKDVEAEAACRAALAVQQKLVADFATVPDYRLDLAGSYVNYGRLLLQRRQSEAGLDWLGKAIPLLEAILAEDRRALQARLFLRNAHASRGYALCDLKRYAESLRGLQRADELDDGSSRPFISVYRSLALAHTGQQIDPQAMEHLLSVATKPPKTPFLASLLYRAACVYAVAATASKDDMKRLEAYAARAVALLRQAKKEGLLKAMTIEDMRKDTDLVALRRRDDYRQFVAELEQLNKGD
jgi:serine/threonine protein kinase